MTGLARLMIILGVCLLGLSVPITPKAQAFPGFTGKCTGVFACAGATVGTCKFNAGFVPACAGTLGFCGPTANLYGCSGFDTVTGAPCVVLFNGCK